MKKKKIEGFHVPTKCIERKREPKLKELIKLKNGNEKLTIKRYEHEIIFNSNITGISEYHYYQSRNTDNKLPYIILEMTSVLEIVGWEIIFHEQYMKREKTKVCPKCKGIGFIYEKDK